MQISQSIALVTGASSGIGAATARALAAQGAVVALAARGEAGLSAVAGEIRAAGGAAHVFAADLSDPAAAAGLHARLTAEVGHPAILVNSAGAGRWLFTEETEPAEMMAMMAAPYYCAFLITRLCLPEMLRRGAGHIVNINSPVARLTWPGAAAYTAARFALEGFTRSLRLDLRGTGVGVSSVVPGRTDTDYFVHNPGVLKRAPRISRILPTVKADQVAVAVLGAIRHNRREVVLPALLRVFYAFQQVMPGLVEWLLASSGWRHEAMAR